MACERCGAGANYPQEPMHVPHRCCTCLDNGFVRRKVPLGDGQFGKRVPCPECRGPEIEREETEYQPHRFNVPRAMWDATLDNWEPGNARPPIVGRNYVVQWPPAKPNLLLHGPTGRGKTHVAAGIQRAVFERHGVRSWFTTEGQLLRRIRATYDEDTAVETEQEVLRIMTHIPLLILDDVGTEKPTEWSEGILFAVINERVSEGRPMVVTTNLAEMQLHPRLKSRLLDVSTAERVSFEDFPDYRMRVSTEVRS